MLKLATLIDNPGEPLPETRYRDPRHLVSLGYNGLVIYETTSLSGIDKPESVGTGEIRRWVEHEFDQVKSTIDAARAAGLDVYICYDVLSLPLRVVEGDEGAMTCRNQQVLCPASEAAVRRSVQALDAQLRRWPDLAGIVLRHGDNDARRLPHLVGNDIFMPHCPRCSSMGRVDRLVRIVEQFHRLVVTEHGKRLIVRAWNVRPGGMHDTPELADAVAGRLPGEVGDDRLVLSFKFTQTDFWRYQRWNPSSLRMDGRPVLYELQCQREFEGKGGIPNWQVPLWRDGAPEVGDDAGGLAAAASRVELAGLWAWVRGGGWGGPFISSEAWVDANVSAAPMLAENPRLEPQQLADHWIRESLGVEEPGLVNAIRDILMRSPELVRRAFYIGPYARRLRKPWHPNGDWIQDDLLDAEAAWRIVRNVPDEDLDELVREKEEAVAMIERDRAALYRVMGPQHQATIEPLVNTLTYAESFISSLRDLLAGLVAYRRMQKSRDPSYAEECRRRLMQAQSHWNHHTQRHGSLPGAATAFREENFWELTQRILAELSG